MPTASAKQPMAMLDEQVPRPGEPRLPGIEKQVVAVRVRPIGHRHAGVVRRHQPADPDQRKRRAANATAQRWGQGLSSWCGVRFTRDQIGDLSHVAECRMRPMLLSAVSATRSAICVRRRLRLRVVVGVDFRRAVFVRPAVDDRLEVEVAVARRAGRLPFQAVRVPRIAAGLAGRRTCCRRS